MDEDLFVEIFRFDLELLESKKFEELVCILLDFFADEGFALAFDALLPFCTFRDRLSMLDWPDDRSGSSDEALLLWREELFGGGTDPPLCFLDCDSFVLR